MANNIRLYSIRELLGMNFFIPSYQRGYRWSKQQVEDLLNDIYNFAIKDDKKKGEFYCLQPIVVKQYDWERIKDGQIESVNGWEVVDGQQRLTTLRILFTYLIKEHLKGESLKKEYDKDVFCLEYETREDTEKFLIKIAEDNDDNIDFYHISVAYKTIREWFESKESQRSVREAILQTLVKDFDNQKKTGGVVRVIWYQIESETNAINTFIRINLGKISLTSSELIKALFLQERNFGDANETAKLRQLEIANEWDRIENALQDDEFWWFLNKGENIKPTRIEFILDLICSSAINHDPSIIEKIGADRYSTFRFFYQKFDSSNNYEFIKSEWEVVTNYFNTFIEWYNNPTWYHYIGFLIYCNESIVNIYNFTKFDPETLKPILTKEEITRTLKKRISGYFKKIKWKIDSEGEMFLDLTYGNDKVKPLLLLFNLEYIVKHCEAKTLIYKFPFKLFKEIKSENGKRVFWDVEHIDSFTTNHLNDRNSKEEWLTTAYNDIKDEIQDQEFKVQIEEYIKNKNSAEDFYKLQSKIIELVGENENDEDMKNNIGNLALLDAGTNRGYGNALFPTKRRKIIEKDKSGIFIPICTKNVFLKYFDPTGTSRTKWSIVDIKNYRDEVTKTLEEFLPTKPQTDNE